jgi:hypothetical protein
MSDPRHTAVERAVRVAAAALVSREIDISAALAVFAAAMRSNGAEAETATPREIAAAERLAHRARVVDKMVLLESQGRGRDAADIVAHRYAADVNDPIEMETLKNKFRRWWRAEEKRAYARLPSSGSATP